MTSHHNKRVRNEHSTLRRRLMQALSTARAHNQSRRLLCEQLERRYALHGMGWYDHSTDHSMIQPYDDAYGGSLGAVTSTMHSPSNHSKAESVARWESTDDYDTDSYGMVDRAATEYSTDELQSLDGECDHQQSAGGRSTSGLRPEAEGPAGGMFHSQLGSGSNPGAVRESLGGLRPQTGSGFPQNSVSKPEPKIEDSKLNLPASGSNAPLGSKPSDLESIIVPVTVPKMTTGDSIRIITPAGNESVPGGSIVAGASGLHPSVSNSPVSASDFVGSAFKTASVGVTSQSAVNSNSTFSSNSNAKSFNASEQSSNTSRGVAPTLSSNKVEPSSVASTTSTVFRSSSVVENANSVRSTSMSAVDALITRLSTFEIDARSAAKESASLSDAQTDSLLNQLRSVIEQIASERPADRSDAVLSFRLNASSQGQSEDFANALRRQSASDDGMLELAASTEKLTPNTSISEESTSDQRSGDHFEEHHRSQLLASLELNREFELAGQTAEAFGTVVDPEINDGSSQRAIEQIAQWTSAGKAAIASGGSEMKDAADVPSEGSIWQRSLAPLSFLAIGALLIRVRKNRKQDAKQLPQS